MRVPERMALTKAAEDIAALQTMVGELVGRVGVLEAQAAVQAKARAAKAAKRDDSAA